MPTVQDIHVTTFNDVRTALDMVPNINSGGCGISALAMARWIAKNEPLMTCIFVLAHHDMPNFKENSTYMTDHKGSPTSCAHAGLIVFDHRTQNQVIVDSSRTFPMGKYEFYNVFKDETVLLKAINRVDKWNDSFDRRHVATIAEVLGIDLSDVNCQTHEEYANSVKAHLKLTKELVVDNSGSFFDPIRKVRMRMKKIISPLFSRPLFFPVENS